MTEKEILKDAIELIRRINYACSNYSERYGSVSRFKDEIIYVTDDFLKQLDQINQAKTEDSSRIRGIKANIVLNVDDCFEVPPDIMQQVIDGFAKV